MPEELFDFLRTMPILLIGLFAFVKPDVMARWEPFVNAMPNFYRRLNGGGERLKESQESKRTKARVFGICLMVFAFLVYLGSSWVESRLPKTRIEPDTWTYPAPVVRAT